jgi:hypothetical protein
MVCHVGARFQFNQINLAVCKDLHDLNQSARLIDRRKNDGRFGSGGLFDDKLPTTTKRVKLRELVSATLQCCLFCLCIVLF